VVGLSPKFLESNFESCRYAGRNLNRYGIKNEESTVHPEIIVCGAPGMDGPSSGADSNITLTVALCDNLASIREDS
jgi:hypothetical protein